VSGLSGRIEGGEHVLPVRVYYEDTDAAGIAYYANYLKFAERGRTEMLRLAGIQQSEVSRRHGVAFAVRDCMVDYRQPARLDDLVEVRSRLTGLRGASADMAQVISRDGAALVRLDLRIACIGQNGRPSRFPAALRTALERYRQTEEQR
jgi:acyl-CoA thioester hydrolase